MTTTIQNAAFAAFAAILSASVFIVAAVGPAVQIA